MGFVRISQASISKLIGRLASLERPRILVNWAILVFAKIVKIDLEEAEKSISSYKSVQDLFSRKLKDGIRKFDSSLGSPIDGSLRSVSRSTKNAKEEVKGLNYTIQELLTHRYPVADTTEFIVYNFYLSPRDYHRIHAPCELEIESISYVPGYLWPVNDFSLKKVDKLFAINERLVLKASSEFGNIYLVFVAAFNVGNIRFTQDSTFLESLYLNKLKFSSPVFKSYSENFKCQQGAEIGGFSLGSSVLLLFENDFDTSMLGQAETKISIGKSLL